jgi:hypothetical protein
MPPTFRLALLAGAAFCLPVLAHAADLPDAADQRTAVDSVIVTARPIRKTRRWSPPPASACPRPPAASR